nr:ORF2 [Epsilontorquevirus sp.]
MVIGRKEQAWYNTCRSTHGLWCSCGDWFNHLLKVHEAHDGEIQLWLTGGEGDTAGDREEDAGERLGENGGGRDDDGHGSAMDDAVMVAAADAAEDEDARSEP